MKGLSLIKSSLRKADFLIYERPFELNIVGIRADSTTPNSFDDVILIFYQDDQGKAQLHLWPATTDPGTFWLHSPMHPQGTAILKGNMQYVGAYGISLHRNLPGHEARCQINGEVTVIRDYDRDSELDFWNGTEMAGWYGINIHRARATGTTREVQRYSAGCQVFANAEEFEVFMDLCREHRRRYGNVFTYTLLDQRALRRTRRRRTLYAGGAIGLAGLGGYGLYKWLNNRKR